MLQYVKQNKTAITGTITFSGNLDISQQRFNYHTPLPIFFTILNVSEVMNSGNIHFPNIFFLFSIKEALKISFSQKHFYEIIAIKYLDYLIFTCSILVFPWIPYISVEAMVVYFFSIIVQFNDGKQGYLGQFSDYENTYLYLKCCQ